MPRCVSLPEHDFRLNVPRPWPARQDALRRDEFIGTEGSPIAPGNWHHVAAVKSGTKLEVFFDSQPVGARTAPECTTTTARGCALGGNPRYTGNEFLAPWSKPGPPLRRLQRYSTRRAATFADFGLWERALSAVEIQRLAVR